MAQETHPFRDPNDELRDALALVYEAVAEVCGMPAREQFETAGHEAEAMVRALHRTFREQVARYQFEVGIWSPDGAHLMEVIAGANHALVAVAAYEATLTARPNDRVTLRQGTRVIRERVVGALK